MEVVTAAKQLQLCPIQLRELFLQLLIKGILIRNTVIPVCFRTFIDRTAPKRPLASLPLVKPGGRGSLLPKQAFRAQFPRQAVILPPHGKTKAAAGQLHRFQPDNPVLMRGNRTAIGGQQLIFQMLPCNALRQVFGTAAFLNLRLYLAADITVGAGVGSDAGNQHANCQRQNRRRAGTGLLGNAFDARTHRAFAHHGCVTKEIPVLASDQRKQGAPIGDTLPRRKPRQRALVAR